MRPVTELERDVRRGLFRNGQGQGEVEAYGEEMIEKKVSMSGNSGRIYLPPDWVGHHVKIIRVD
jgi:putative transposon-encoded protein